MNSGTSLGTTPIWLGALRGALARRALASCALASGRLARSRLARSACGLPHRARGALDRRLTRGRFARPARCTPLGCCAALCRAAPARTRGLLPGCAACTGAADVETLLDAVRSAAQIADHAPCGLLGVTARTLAARIDVGQCTCDALAQTGAAECIEEVSVSFLGHGAQPNAIAKAVHCQHPSCAAEVAQARSEDARPSATAATTATCC